MAAPRTLKLHLEARSELEISVNFYRDRGGEALAEMFKRRVGAGFDAIRKDPERFPEVKGMVGVKKYRVRQFPFSILFIDRPEHIWVIALAHGSRKPGYWVKRMKAEGNAE